MAFLSFLRGEIVKLIRGPMDSMSVHGESVRCKFLAVHILERRCWQVPIEGGISCIYLWFRSVARDGRLSCAADNWNLEVA